MKEEKIPKETRKKLVAMINELLKDVGLLRTAGALDILWVLRINRATYTTLRKIIPLKDSTFEKAVRLLIKRKLIIKKEGTPNSEGERFGMTRNKKTYNFYVLTKAGCEQAKRLFD